MAKTVIGIDVSKSKVDVCCLPSETRFVANEEEYEALIEKLAELAPDLIVLEATGGYEKSITAGLADAGLPFFVVNPARVRSYAKALNFLAKTDAIDAYVIARFGLDVNLEPRSLDEPKSAEMQAFLARRRQIVKMRVAEQNRFQQARVAKIRTEIKETIKYFTEKLKEIDKDIDSFIKQNPVWTEKQEILTSVPGVGDQTARVLITELPELGHLNRSQIARLVGVAPINQDSGQFRGQRHIAGGRIQVRCTLYMSCLTAIRINPVISVYYKRLTESGKKKKAAIVACMRKLIIMMNTMVKNKTHFSPVST